MDRLMIERHRQMMREPGTRGLMRAPEMRTMHRAMKRTDGGIVDMHDDMPAVGTGMMD
ncbi:MAG: hypothetical protein ACRDPC_17090 [Solirubrobacteraceae bacterium]